MLHEQYTGSQCADKGLHSAEEVFQHQQQELDYLRNQAREKVEFNRGEHTLICSQVFGSFHNVMGLMQAL